MCDMLLVLIPHILLVMQMATHPFVVRDNIAVVIKPLEEKRENILNWFLNN